MNDDPEPSGELARLRRQFAADRHFAEVTVACGGVNLGDWRPPLTGQQVEIAVRFAREALSGTCLPPDSSLQPPVEDLVQTPQAALDSVQIGRYRVIRKLGEGGMGAVYEAVQEGLQRRVALKLLPYILTRDPKYVERFKREARAAAGLDHPNIVTVFDVGEEDGQHYISMEYVEGESLRDRLSRERLLTDSDAISLMLQAVRGLACAWERGIIHRDIKPANLLLRRDGLLKVADFGLAKVLTDEESLTQSGAGMGTPHYMSPEQAQNAKGVDLRADIYSLGATFYHLVTGRVPFEGTSPIEAAIKVATAPLPPVRRVNPNVPVGVARVIERMLARRPEDRPNSADELVEALSDAGAAGAVQAPGLVRGFLQRLVKSHSGTPAVVRAADTGSGPTPQAHAPQPGRTVVEAERPSPKGFEELLKLAQAAYASGKYGESLKCGLEARLIRGHERAEGALDICHRAGLYGRRKAAIGGWSVRTYEGHTKAVACVGWSPDGQGWALSGSADETLRLWEVYTGHCVEVFRGHTSCVDCVAWCPTGRWVLSASWDNSLRLWEVASGRLVRTFDGHTREVASAAWSPDGRWALSGGWDMTLRLWEVASGRSLRTLAGHSTWVTSVAWSPDGRYALSGSEDRTLRLWELSTGQCLRTFEGHTGKVTSVAWSPDGRRVLSGSADKTLRLWQPSTGDCVQSVTGHSGPVNAVAFGPDGRWALSGSDDKTVRLWELGSGKCAATFEGHSEAVKSVASSANGRWALSGSEDHTLRLWELDWMYEFPQARDWDEGATPYLEIFLTLHTPYAGKLPKATASDADVWVALEREGKLTWTDEDFQALLADLQNRGYGWLRPEGVRRQLEKMTAEWKGPASFPTTSPGS